MQAGGHSLQHPRRVVDNDKPRHGMRRTVKQREGLTVLSALNTPPRHSCASCGQADL